MSDVPGDGWDVVLLGDMLLVELVEPLKISDTITLVGIQKTTDPGIAIHKRVECHGIVTQISESCQERWKNVFRLGDRVSITGAGNFLTVNYRDFVMLPMTTIGCILRRKDVQPQVPTEAAQPRGRRRGST